MPSISVRRLYQDNQQKLQMTWVAGTAGGDNRIAVEADRPALALVGHLNFIHHNQAQVCSAWNKPKPLLLWTSYSIFLWH